MENIFMNAAPSASSDNTAPPPSVFTGGFPSSVPADMPAGTEEEDELLAFVTVADLDPAAVGKQDEGRTLRPIPDGVVKAIIRLKPAEEWKDGKKTPVLNKNGSPAYYRVLGQGNDRVALLTLSCDIYDKTGDDATVVLRNEEFEITTRVSKGTSAVYDFAARLARETKQAMPTDLRPTAMIPFIVNTMKSIMADKGGLVTELRVTPQFAATRPATPEDLAKAKSDKRRESMQKYGVDDYTVKLYGRRVAEAAAHAGDTSARPKQAMWQGTVRTGRTVAFVNSWA